MYFPKPYPDELLGGVAGRAVRHLGLPFRTFVKGVLQRPDANLSFFLPADLRRWAWLTGQTPLLLLLNHTPFPYWCAFRSEAVSRRHIQSLIEPQDFLGAQFSRWTGHLRFTKLRLCPECVLADVREHGESYWHRTHFLPTVLLCPIHQVPLLEDASPWSARRAFNLLPQDLQRNNLVGHDHDPLLSATLTQASVRTLSACRENHDDWSEVYRSRAHALGYVTQRAELTGTQFAADLESHYGRSLLRVLESHWEPPLMRAWPVLMLSRKCQATFSPAKHILLQAFLSESSGPGRRATKKTGPKPVDLVALDADIARQFQQCWDAVRSAGVRSTVRAILDSLQLQSTVRNKRSQLPKTAALMRAFRESSAWQPGGRRPRAKQGRITP